MKRTLTTIKEALQYAGIIALSCLSAVWLVIRNKLRDKK